MNNIAIIMNTNEVGGAERSLVFQLQNRSESNFTFYLPRISGSRDLELFLMTAGLENIKYYEYPTSLYSLSRANLKLNLKMLKDLYQLVAKRSELSDLGHFDMVYLNGNKAALLFLLTNRFRKFQGKVVWHLRDYYHSRKLTNIMWRILNGFSKESLSFVCNSNSVKESLAFSPWKNFPVEVIYNPVGVILPTRDAGKKIKTIGFVSMMAPWKGVHEIVLWSKLFERELFELGITQVKIYGGDIYKTEGGHSGYGEQIQNLHQKFNSRILSFEGHKEPLDIFQEIDCLIHYSLSPEPFGRVILEAFDAGIPVISTCLGGAAELVQNHVSGIKVFSHDRQGLFLAVKELIENKMETLKLISGGIEKSKIIQRNISFNMTKVLEMEAAS